ncbi:MAG: ATP-dependent DNA helicase RecG [Legionellaceae bacterium]
MINYLKQSQTIDNIPCSSLKGVGPKIAAQLEYYGIHNIQDLLFHLPLRYQDRTRITPIGDLRTGDQAVIHGMVENIKCPSYRSSPLTCTLRDSTGAINLRFFHFTKAQKNNLLAGIRLYCFGEVRGKGSKLEIIHPEYRKINETNLIPVEESLTPIYPSIEGISQTILRQLIDKAISFLENTVEINDYLPFSIINSINLPNLVTALKYIHRPTPDSHLSLLEKGQHPAQQRLIFEELLAHQISLRRLRKKLQKQLSPSMSIQGELGGQFLKTLPFTLTQAQQRVIKEIKHDLTLPYPMLRLVQGDVGSGKTIIAALCALQAIENNYQATLMAPTEILAEQHYQNFCHWFNPLNIEVAWLSGKLKNKLKTEMHQKIREGTASIIVGTHALFQKEVTFSRLGLVIIDEQHRFGVHQRLSLREKGSQQGLFPHQLIMTATPIPRTLAMTAYADLDQSIIDELPPGRTPVTTVAIPNEKRNDIIERIRKACEENKQVYWVCTLIEESLILQCQAAENIWEELKRVLPNIEIGLIHGRLKPQEKETMMTAFKKGEIKILVATTVIEVGVDVPNASLMIIENPERLGLAQLHQLRGRVGRGSTISYCVLLYQSPLSQTAKERLQILRQSHDGFEIAQKDLEIRGAGEILGTRQTGIVSFKIANLIRDNYLIPRLQPIADTILNEYPQIVEPLIKRWLGNDEKYGHVC